MIKHANDLDTSLLPNLKGGRDTVRVVHILKTEEMHGTGRMFGVQIIPPGGSIGKHVHEGDFETYYILRGKGRINDNGNVQELYPGDMAHCCEGDYHELENIGDEDLAFLAVIQFTEIKH
ncbi:cupin domain-containing protein [Clostridium sp. AM58-1XD]|uniref:cupin domain-containing protein n=1 Tax=Clostridium sp. AM58-1XD TaxID=2292307 RepID=UPI000E4E965B|nr:cupin domain-containing protein [Clostridium sp. AM58-1XD]RGY97623.1 cupin domain-containing protein [Clostridium sp. AM58-1XD]